MVPFQTIPPSESFGWKDFFDSLGNSMGCFYTGRNHPVTFRHQAATVPSHRGSVPPTRRPLSVRQMIWPRPMSVL